MDNPNIPWTTLVMNQSGIGQNKMKINAETQSTLSIAEKAKGGRIKSLFLRVLSALSAPLR